MSSFFPPRPSQLARPRASTDYPLWPPLDTLYDYTQILSQTTPIGQLPQAFLGIPVAIVGAGPAGMVAAFEALRMGLSPVVFEASDRIGGRNWSEPTSIPNAFVEMGAMRFPPSGKVFSFYAFDWFQLQTGTFPDPGKVLTTLYYENQVLTWEPEQPPPGQFVQLQTDWDTFIGSFVNQINQAYASGGMQQVAQVWQQYIDQYAGLSFYEALVQGIPQWTPEDFNAFGALGIGSGGFGPLYDVSFLEMLRIVLNGWETDQQLLIGGISELTQHFYTTPVTQPDGTTTSLEQSGAVVFNAQVTGLGFNDATMNPVVYWTQNNAPQSQEFWAVIVAMPTRSMEVSGMTLPTLNGPSPSDVQLFQQSARVGIRDLHTMSSSKMFIVTDTKFWQSDPTIPQNIQTDEMVRGVYCLDYPQLTQGVVLISYTWGDDSDKLLALPPIERFALFKSIISTIDPTFASYLVPADGQVYNVDWQTMPNYYGAFKLNLPGQDPWLWALYYQFQSSSGQSGVGPNSYVYVAGDSVSWSGGWTEGALETGINAVCAVAGAMGATFSYGSPLDQNPYTYDYGQASPGSNQQAPRQPYAVKPPLHSLAPR